jgi:hypothetical protein
MNTIKFTHDREKKEARLEVRKIIDYFEKNQRKMYYEKK